MVSSTGVIKVYPGRILNPGFDPTNSTWYREALITNATVLTKYRNFPNIQTFSKAIRFKRQLKYVQAFDLKTENILLNLNAQDTDIKIVSSPDQPSLNESG